LDRGVYLSQTLDEILEAFPEAEDDAASLTTQLEELFACLYDHGIAVYDSEDEATAANEEPGEAGRGGDAPDLSDISTDDTIGLYFSEVSRVPLLTPDEEVELAKRLERGQEARRQLARNGRDPQERARLKRLIAQGEIVGSASRCYGGRQAGDPASRGGGSRMKSAPTVGSMLQDSGLEESSRHHFEALQADFFSNRALIIAANRGPVTFRTAEDGNLRFQRGEGGLVTALIGLCRHADAVWIACARTEADAIWREGNVAVAHDSTVRVQFLSPEPSAYEGYYNVIANPLLWFLQHSMWDVPRAPVIDRATWQAWEEGYVTVNRLFADAIAKQVIATSRPTLVMLQDYHLYLVARFLRQRLRPRERPTILHFVHIPWPGPEYWRILPPAMRQAILDGLCAVDVLGFQTREDGLNFIRTCESHLPRAHVNFKRGRVWYRNHATHVRDFPISIDVKALKQLAGSPEVAEYRLEIQDVVGNRQLILRLDRIEPSKNIVRGFQAFEEMLEFYPEHREQVVLLALLVPSRIEVDEYQDYLDDLMAAAGRINARYGTSEWEPVRILVGENYPRAVAALQLYDVLLVNAIADGMNLVAKEGPVVNQRHGVLILSERTGARQQLEPGALVISPCDVYATAEALHQALVMPPEERRERAERLRWLIEREDIAAWLGRQLETVAELNL